MKTIAQKLNSKNLKATPQRIAIYDYLIQHKNHPNAETIYTALKDEYPAMSLATVYKTVASLRDVGLVQEINVGEDSFRYDAFTDDHAHIICRRCHKVYDFERNVNVEVEVREIEQKFDVTVDACRIFFYGMCAECAKKTALT